MKTFWSRCSRKHVHVTVQTQTRLLNHVLRQWKIEKPDFCMTLGNYSRYHRLSPKLYLKIGALHRRFKEQVTPCELLLVIHAKTRAYSKVSNHCHINHIKRILSSSLLRYGCVYMLSNSGLHFICFKSAAIWDYNTEQ